jgi:UDP-N-acetylmuramate--alanine ligase
MSALARILHAQGIAVAGSDAKESHRLLALQQEGIETFVGHRAENLLDPQGEPRFTAIARSTAVPATNPELLSARAFGMTMMSRADLLVEVTSQSRVLAVAGTHGKTTTTSMLTLILQAAGWDPSFAIGSELNETGSNAHWGSGQFCVVEADESDGTFLRLGAEGAIITNIEPDHLNYWGSFEKLETAFTKFITDTLDRQGHVVVCLDDAGVQSLLERLPERRGIITYGTHSDADFRLVSQPNGWGFTIHHGGDSFELRLKVPGVHNQLNATAAAALAVAVGVGGDAILEGLHSFSGTKRRFDYKGEADGVRVFDDYAHHPTEIAATLNAARLVVGTGKVVVAFQAHHYYRTALFSKEFGEALGLADFVVVLEVFAPGEEFIPGSGGQTLADHVPLAQSNVVFEPSWSRVAQHLVGHSNPGDIIMTLGAGEIGMLCSDIVTLLHERESTR